MLNKKIIIAIVVYLLWVVYNSTSSYFDSKSELIKELDRQLFNGAMSLPIILHEGFHKQSMDQATVTHDEDWENINRLTRFTETIELKYIYSLIRKDQKILFTVSSATKEELRTKEGISPYFSEYEDAPPEVKVALDTGRIQFAEYSDKWGHFRSVFIPLESEDGLRYVSGADIEISHIKLILRGNLLENLLNSFLSLLFIVPFIFVNHWLVLQSNKSLIAAKGNIELAHDELQQYKDELEITVKERTEELEKANDQLKKLSLIDSLTNIANRRAYDESVEREVKAAKRSNNPVALLMIDIDFFKLYNDHYGHDKGDVTLCRVAESIAKSLPRSIDLVARIGGEEFVALLPDTDIRGACSVAERIQLNVKSLAIPHEYADDMKVVTVSIGYTSLKDSELNVVDLFKQADTALYKAKEAGRNRVEVFR